MRRTPDRLGDGLVVRLTKRQRTILDRKLRQMRLDHPGMTCTVSDVVRMLIMDAQETCK